MKLSSPSPSSYGVGSKSSVKSHSSSSSTKAGLSQTTKIVDGVVVVAETEAEKLVRKAEAGREKVEIEIFLFRNNARSLHKCDPWIFTKFYQSILPKSLDNRLACLVVYLTIKYIPG